MNTVLSLENVTIAYDGQIAVDNVSFDVNSGDYICIVGENGSGKSTLIKGILKLIPIKSGKITINFPAGKGGFGYLPQQTPVKREFPASVNEVIMSGCISSALSFPFYSRSDKQKAHEYMEYLGISGFDKRSFRELSGGERQKVLLCRALCAANGILVLDEPVCGLDVLATNEMYTFLNKINRDLSMTILMISHDISYALQYAGKVLHIDKKMLFYGDTDSYLVSDASKKLSEHTCHGERDCDD